MANEEVKQRVKALLITAVWIICWGLFTISDVGNAERLLKTEEPTYVVEKEMRQGFALRLLRLMWNGKSSYEHVWPVRVYYIYIRAL